MRDTQVLIVEDDSDLREAIVDTLEASSYRVASVADRPIALAFFGILGLDILFFYL